MARHYKPVIVVIKKKSLPLERSLELPIDISPEPSHAKTQPQPSRGVTILKIHGDEKI